MGSSFSHRLVAAIRPGLFGLLLACCCMPGWGQPALRLVTEPSPYAYVVDGKVGGPATEKLALVLQRAGLTDCDIAIYPWARAYDIALRQPNVLIYLIARTPEREAQFKWVGEFLQHSYAFYKLKTRHDIQITQLADARAYSVGLSREDVRHQYLKGQGFTRLLLAAQTTETVRYLLNGRVDLVVLTESDLTSLCQQDRQSCTQLQAVHRLESLRGGLYAACSQATPDALVQRLRLAFQTLQHEGRLKL